MGSIYRQKGRAIWMMKFLGADGRPIVETTGKDDRKEAEQVLRDRESDIHRGAAIVGGVGKLTFEDAAKAIKADYRQNGQTSIGDLDRRVDLHLAPFFRGRKMTSISTADIRLYTKWRQAQRCSECAWTGDGGDEPRPTCPRCGEPVDAGAAPATVNHELAALKRMFNLAIEDGRLLHAPYFPMLTLNNARTGFLEPEMFAAIHAKLARRWVHPVVQDIAEFTYYTGWRVASEVLPLEWEKNVDMRAGIVRLLPGQTKTRKGRIFPFASHPELRALMQRRERARKGKMLFHRDGQVVKSFRGAWDEAVTDAGYEQLLRHDMRRTAVRNLVRAGVPEKVAMELTGHKTRSVFDRYNIVNEADLHDAVARYGQARPQPAKRRGQVVRRAKFGRKS